MSDLVERLRGYASDDHERGCQGRYYDCSCGYDGKRDPLLEEAANRIAQLEDALRPFACECVGFCKDAKHNYGEVEPIDTCKYGRNRAALERNGHE